MTREREQALWISEAAARLWDEVSPGDEITFINIGVVASGQHVIYTLVEGDPEIRRHVIPDIAAALGDAGAVFTRHVVNATLPESERP